MAEKLDQLKVEQIYYELMKMQIEKFLLMHTGKVSHERLSKLWDIWQLFDECSQSAGLPSCAQATPE